VTPDSALERGVVVALIAVALPACATQGQVRTLHEQIATVSAGVTALQAREPTTTVDEGLRNEVRTLSAQMVTLEGRVADAAALIGRLEARVTTAERTADQERAAREAMQASIARLTPAVPPPPAVAAEPAGPPGEAPPANARGRDTIAAREIATPNDPAAARGGAPAEHAYHAALAAFRAGEHGQAVLEFLDFVSRYPSHLLAANAQYWIGEAYYLQRDYRQALVELEKVLVHGATHPKAADALLKMGMAHRALREPGKARAVWERVVREYPKSEAAAKARALLEPQGADARR
jgi:tol-pal system protein YbgF